MTLEEKLETFSQTQMGLKDSNEFLQLYLPLDALEDPDNKDSLAELILSINWNSVVRDRLAQVESLDEPSRFLLNRFVANILDILDDARYTSMVELDLALGG